MKPTVLILCAGNSCRSQLAEGVLRAAAGDLIEVESAGSRPAGFVHPMAVRVMQEIGVDLSAHRSKHLEEFCHRQIETVVTVCGGADPVCPIFPGEANRHHWGFEDPAAATGTEEEKLAVFRRVRDEIRRVFEAYAAGRRDQSTVAPLCPGDRVEPRSVEVFDPAMCCCTGVCGTRVDPRLAQFAADLDWLQRQGVRVQRHNLAQNPAAFVENETVRVTLCERGETALPLLLVNGQVAASGRYPDREELAALVRDQAASDPGPGEPDRGRAKAP